MTHVRAAVPGTRKGLTQRRVKLSIAGGGWEIGIEAEQEAENEIIIIIGSGYFQS
jgi:hypothetical protein